MNSKPGRKRTKHVDIWVDEYVNAGLSTYQLAEKYGVKQDTVKHSLYARGVVRKALGHGVENEVCRWLKEKGVNVEHQKGDAPFDMLCDGVRIDVKSAHLGMSSGYSRYHFAIVHESSKGKNYRDKVDYFYLVFLDKENRPIYKLATSSVFVQRGLSIHDSLNTKYPIELVGYLDVQ